MSNRQTSFFSKFNIYQMRFGLKLNLLVYLILIFSLSVVNIVGFGILRKHIYANSIEITELLAYHSKKNIEVEYADFLKATNKEFSENFTYDVQRLIEGYNDFGNTGGWLEADTLSSATALLLDYYQSEVVEATPWNTPSVEELFPVRNKEIVLQKIYLQSNKWAFDEKDKLFSARINTTYDTYHKKVHTKTREFARKYNLNNIYLVDPRSGDVVYNLNKNIAFATNLFDGNYKSSELAKIFQEVSASTDLNKYAFADFTPFVAEQNKSVAYVAKKVTLYNDMVAVIVFELGPDFFESILYDNWLEKNGSDLSVNVIGDDNILRLNDIEQYHAPSEYFDRLEREGLKNEVLMQAALLGGGANVLGLKEPTSSLLDGSGAVYDYHGEELLYLSFPVKTKGFNWSVISLANAERYTQAIVRVKWIIFIITLLLFVCVTLFLRRFVKSVVTRITRLSNAFRRLSRGEVVESFNIKMKDEIGQTTEEFNTLNERMAEVGQMAIGLSEGEFEKEFKAKSEVDSMAKAINTLRESLKENNEELMRREMEDVKSKWTNEGIAKFNDLLRQSNNDIKELAYIVIENMVEYLDLVQGGVFLVEGEEEASKTIQLISAYAYDRRKYNEKTIEIGEGLIGNCYMEKKSIHLNNIPEGYLDLSSGLGSAIPRTLYIVPLMKDTDVLGFVEMASLNELEQYQVDFIEKLAENIAATFETVKLNTRTAELLEESKRRANEITQQEEEMRQNMEEMLATQEELARIREEDEKNQKELQAKIKVLSGNLEGVLNAFDGEVIVKDSSGVILLANNQACKRYNLSKDEIRGRLDVNVLDKVVIESEKELDTTAINDGEFIGYRSENVEGMLVEYVIEKRAFSIEGQEDMGVITFWKKQDKMD